MERWAANTLRTLGIILTCIVVVCGSLLLILLGQCASSGGYGGVRNPSAGASYFLGAALLGLAGVTLVAVLARDVHRSRQTAPNVAALPEASASTATPALSLEGRRAVERLFWCLAAQLALTALECIYSWLQNRQLPQMRTYAPLFLISSILHAIPFAVLIGLVRKRISRIVLAFALGIPAAAILNTLVVILPMARLYLASPQSLGTIILPLILNVLLVVLAYQAALSTGLQSPASSILTSAVAAFVYFYVLHLALPFIYRIAIRH